MKRILLHAFGNPGRNDDGLGNECIEALDAWIKQNKFQSVATNSSFQLNVEDCADIIHYDVVVFIDASKEEIESFSFAPVTPESHLTYTTHSVTPSSLLALCMELYTHHPAVYLLQIKGFEWEFKEGLSDAAKKNLEKAITFLQSKTQEWLV